jgi:hypothetical protein
MVVKTRIVARGRADLIHDTAAAKPEPYASPDAVLVKMDRLYLAVMKPKELLRIRCHRLPEQNGLPVMLAHQVIE